MSYHNFLIVDDEPSVRDVIKHFIEKKYKGNVTVACTGEEALEILQKRNDFDVILLDLYLGKGKSGVDIFKTLKESPETADIPVVLMSGQQVQVVTGDPLTKYLSKPCTPLDVMGVLNEVSPGLETLIEGEPIIVISGPTAAGKTTFFSQLEKRMSESGLDYTRITRATTRPKRAGELDGHDFKFYTSAEFDKAVKKGTIAADYEHSGFRYGILTRSLDVKTPGYKLVTIRDPAGIANLRSMKDQISSDIIPVLVYSDEGSIKQRIATRLNQAQAKKEKDNIIEQLGELEQELFSFMDHRDQYRYLIFNHSSSTVPHEDVINHLVNRMIGALRFEKDQKSGNLDIRVARELYIESLTQKLFGAPLDSIRQRTGQIAEETQQELFLDSNKAVGFDKEAINRYLINFGLSPDDLKVPHVLGFAISHGILSIYIHQDEKNKQRFCDFVEFTLGIPQYRYDKFDAVPNPPMSLTNISDAYVNFYMSFSLAYDPPKLPDPNAPLHTLTIEAIVNGGKPKRIYKLDTEKAKDSWENRKSIIPCTGLPRLNAPSSS